MDKEETTNDIEPQTEEQEQSVDPLKAEALMRQLESQQNLPMGIAGGAVAAIIGASIWAVVTVMTERQLGLMAIGVGLLVGYSVRITGKGISTNFGVVGVVFALLGCALGNLLSICGFVAIEESMSYFEVVTIVFTQPTVIIELMQIMFQPMDLLFYAIAGYEGYKFSFRKVTEEEFAKLN